MKKSYSKPEFEKIDLLAGEQILAATLDEGNLEVDPDQVKEDF